MSASHTASTSNFWAGWTAFGAIMIIISGAVNGIQGLVAVFQDSVYVAGPKGGALIFDVTQWGWIHLVLGLILIGVGLGLIRGATWARVLGVIVVMINMITQMMLLPEYPFWSVIVIGFDAVVLWAITVHGSETLDSADSFDQV
jgi:hypothetical protein